MSRHSLGRRGERAAARALRRAGYRLLGRNLETPEGEVDLLAREGGVLVVIEVKTRATQGPPRVAHAQRQRLAAAARWLASRPRLRTALGAPSTFRVDYAFVTLDARRFVVTIRRDMMRQS